MNKIGIAIKSTSAGSSQPSVINAGDWIKRVIDVRDILKHVPAMCSDHSHVAVFMSFTEDACLITVARTVSGRPWDNVSGWIYIPGNLVISGEEVSSIISKVKELISASVLPEESELNDVFSKEYETKGVSARYDASKKNGKFAKRYTIVYTLDELLGKYRYQSYYSEYNVVFLVSEGDPDVNAEDLSDNPCFALINLMPPTQEEIQDKLGRSVTLKIASGQNFNGAVLLKKGQTIDLIAEREGFDNLEFSVTVEHDGQECILPKKVWKKSVSSDRFDIRSESGENLNGKAEISVNDSDITKKTQSFSESDCKSAYVVISAKGYNTFKSNLSLLGNNKIQITLSRETAVIRKKIRLKNGSIGEISITGKGLHRYESPIEGYVENDGKLKYMPSNVWGQRFIGFAVAVGIWLIVEFIGWWNSVEFQSSSEFPWFEVVSEEDKKASIEDAQTQYSTDNSQNTNNSEDATKSSSCPTDLNAAIKYLDYHKEWERDSLNKYPELEGLFEELDSYQFEKILDRHSVLNGSTQFMKVYNAAQRNKSKLIDGNYNEDGDYVITIDTYIKKIDNKPDDSSSVPEEVVVANEAAKPAKSTKSTKTTPVVTPTPNPKEKTKPQRGQIVI